MSRSWKAYLPLLWILVIPVINIFYAILNQAHIPVYSLMTDLDAHIPFVPIFIIPYLIWYPFIFIVLILLCVREQKVYYRTLVTQCIGLLACYLIFFLFQTTVDRPQTMGSGIFERLVGLVYSTDNPYNCFPSIHVLTSYLMIKGAVGSDFVSKRERTAVKVCAWSIIASTLFVKQHVLLDVAGAIALVEILWYGVGRLSRGQQSKFKGEIVRQENVY
ncbi:serine/threonine protein phosphatase [Bacillus sp. FJAT-18019]|nr:serine/threonine protein phosphatase [Bacillus sp. FJAT-18019]